MHNIIHSVCLDMLVTVAVDSNTRQERPTESAEHIRQSLMTVNTLLSRANGTISPIELQFKQPEHRPESTQSSPSSASSSASATAYPTASLAENTSHASVAGATVHNKSSTPTASTAGTACSFFSFLGV